MMQIRICVDMKNSPLSLDLLPESPVGSGEMICIVLGVLNDEYNLAKKNVAVAAIICINYMRLEEKKKNFQAK